MRVLVTGGAGFIGSHAVIRLADSGHAVTIVDNFSTSKPTVRKRLQSVSRTYVALHEVDLRDAETVERVFADEQFDAVVHFAGLKAVGESVAQPLAYYENNLAGTFTLLRAMDKHGVRRLVFSSSATVYGDAASPVTEDLPTSATNPYGRTKVMIEQVLRDLATADPTWRIALLRYFNPGGAHASGQIGEDPQGVPNNLLPFVAQVAAGRRDRLQVFGDDYPTPDGTCIRDYIHVEDLAAGHLAALDRLSETDESLHTWNLGTGQGHSVLEVLHAFERAAGRELPYEIVGRRPGDIVVSVADPSAALADLGWKAERTLDEICSDHWRWQRANPEGYADAGSFVG